MLTKICTIGVYGTDEESFFAALQQASIDTFVDIRRRRGMRGSEYAFANSARLQTRLDQLGIKYVHLLELAPDEALREAQKEEDKRLKIVKRKREGLGSNFAAAFKAQRLEPLQANKIAAQFGPDARNVVLFCVEREPEACHRSLVAEWLCQELGVEREDLRA